MGWRSEVHPRGRAWRKGLAISGGHTTGDTDWVSRMAYRGIGGHRENTIAHLDGEGARDGNRGRCNSGDAWKSRNRNDLERWTAASCARDRRSEEHTSELQ